MFHTALDLTVVHWLAKHNDETEVHSGAQINGVKKYDLIRRKELDTFSLMYRKNTMIEVHPKDRTLIVRLKTRGHFKLELNGRQFDNNIDSRVWIVVLLAKANENPKRAFIPDPRPELNQEYMYDADESTMYYLYSNGKVETRTKFSEFSPYSPLKMNPIELEHFNNASKIN